MRYLAFMIAVIMTALIFVACANEAAIPADPTPGTAAAITSDQETETTVTEKEEPPQPIDFDASFINAVNYALAAYSDDVDSFLEYYSTDRIGWSSVFNGYIYIVNFETPEYEYNCEVDPITGEVSNFTRSENEAFDPEIVGVIHVDIDEEEALAAALDFLELSENDVTDTSSEYDGEKYVFNVSFMYEETEYICEVDYKGKFLRSNIDIGPNGAQDIAFEHMLDNADNYMMRDDLVNFALAGLMIGLRTNTLGGREDRQYEVGFSVGGFTYRYLIDGLSGEVLNYDRQNDPTWLRDTAGAGYGNYISQYIATKTALDDAGIGSSGFRYRKVTLDTTYRQERYIVYFETEEYAYEYEIDAYSGEILSSERSELIS